ncbi:hypothetical protein Cgig2_024972 [Carnegiea gigantea]|uniref:Uncharacterized protein n=1 Tax=Carnegiea gigantea TaxID=171969 RepID=A0A9Q1JPZ9_9CARY|nr:hypothetical protein Cgig2_024972 [Carnegiea gigantea]
MTPIEPLVQKPPNLVLATQVQQLHQPFKSPASEQTSKRPSLKNAESNAASVPTIEQPHVRISDISPATAYSLHWFITTQTEAHFPYCSSSTTPNSPVYYDLGNEEVISGSILPRDVMNYKKGSKFISPPDKAFDKCVLKHVAKHVKQYKHGLERDYFKPEEKTKEDMYDIVPKGHSCDGWMQLVDYWCSKQHETLAEIGRDAQASQTHCHTTSSTSCAEKRADFNDASAKVQERLLSSSPSKTQVEIENEVFDGLMHEEKNPKRPIGFGFNVDRSDVFGVNSILRKRGYIFPDSNMGLKCVKEELAS